MSRPSTAHLTPVRSHWWSSLSLLAIFWVIALGVLSVWAARGVYAITGDEPHYLIMVRSFADAQTLDLTGAYLREFATPTLYPPGLAPDSWAGSLPQPPFAHVVEGPNGLTSWHGIGVPVLVAGPTLLLGELGARLTMILLASSLIPVAWRIAAGTFADRRTRWWVLAPLVLTYPLIPASTQIYPDLLAGVVCLWGVWLLLSPTLTRRSITLAGYGVILGFLPWLGTKFAVAAGVLLILGAVVVRPLGSRAVTALVAPAVAMIALLAGYHQWAFGSVLGPPLGNNLAANADALRVLFGLVLDQDQGILIQAPVLLLGLVGLVPFLRRSGLAGLGWAGSFASLWVLGALHPGWYGLGSFVGRYSWGLAVLAIVPAVVGLGLLRAWSERAFVSVLIVALAVDAYVIALPTLLGGSRDGLSLGIDLYTKSPDTWLESYAVWTFPLHGWFPAWYAPDWSWTFWPNLAWLVVAAGLVIVGVSRRAGAVVAVVGVTAVLVAGVIGTPGARAQTVIIDRPAPLAPGYLSGEPIRQMRLGDYEWWIEYSAGASPEVAAGKWELVRSSDQAVVASGELAGTEGAIRTESTSITFRSAQPQEFSLRVATYGRGPMRLIATGVAHAGER